MLRRRWGRRAEGDGHLVEFVQHRVLCCPETLVVDRAHCGGSCLVGDLYVGAICQGEGGRLDLRATRVFEITPTPLAHIERRATEPRSSIDAEDLSSGHGVPALCVDEAGDDRSLLCVKNYYTSEMRR